MNSFKTMLTFCAVMMATCSGQYMTQSMGAQPAAIPALMSQTGMGSYGGSGWGSANQGAFAAASAQQTYAAPQATAPVQQAPAQVPAFPATTQQICTCVAVPSGAQSGASAAAPLDHEDSKVPEVDSAPIASSYAAPTTQQAASSYGASAQQSAFRPAAAARPAYAAARPAFATSASKGTNY